MSTARHADPSKTTDKAKLSPEQEQWIEKLLRSISSDGDLETRYTILRLLKGNGFEYLVENEAAIRSQAKYALTL